MRQPTLLMCFVYVWCLLFAKWSNTHNTPLHLQSVWIFKEAKLNLTTFIHLSIFCALKNSSFHGALVPNINHGQSALTIHDHITSQLRSTNRKTETKMGNWDQVGSRSHSTCPGPTHLRSHLRLSDRRETKKGNWRDWTPWWW